MHYAKPLLAAMMLAAAALPTAHAQQEGPVFAVTYIEVTPSSTETAIRLLRDQARASSAEAGNLRYQILQRIGRPNHFAIIDAWESQPARDRSIATEHTRSFRGGLEPLLYSPYDERPSTPIMDTAARGGEGEVYAVTHVDIIPTALEEGTALLDTLVRASRKEAGAVDFGVIAQNNRRNHMTLFEVWASAEQQSAHA
ncbi:MAG TPA: putative quinol monooxygenase, partial [Gammaproteobacteria bacterium]|nr:putative quinol monooxygenase [Gammaproteobacteria bacterium]